MPVGLRVTTTLFRQIKHELQFNQPLTVAMANHMSVKTILQIKGAQDYSEYELMKKAQHPPTKFSVPERLDAIEEKLDKLIYLAGQNRLL